MACTNCTKNNIKNMNNIQGELTPNEILFATRWDEVIKDKAHVKTEDVDYCYRLVYKQGLQSSCPSCLRDYAATLHNYYKTIQPKWTIYKEEQKQIQPQKEIQTNEVSKIQDTRSKVSRVQPKKDK